MLLTLLLFATAAGHKLALPAQNEAFARQTALVQEVSLRHSRGPDGTAVYNFHNILGKLTDAVASISGDTSTSAPSPATKEETTSWTQSWSERLMSSMQTAPAQIPRRLLFNHKVNLLKASDASLDKQSKLLRDNVKHIVKLFPDIAPSDVHFWDDKDCQAGIEDLNMEESEALGLDFASEKVGMVKSDICRLVMMYSLGGFYFDTDILPLANFEKHMDPRTTFATVIADGGKSYFQAFLAATPKHPVILESLKDFKKWYDVLHRPKQNEELLRRKTARGNIGTALLRKAYKTWSKGAKEESVVMHDGGHVSQFFVEKNDRVLKGFQGVPSHLSGHLCDYAVVDTRSKSVVMFSRIYDKHAHKICREEVSFMHGL